MSDITKPVTFTADVKVKDHENRTVFEAKAGDTVDLPAPSAARWIRREKAVPGKVKITPPAEADTEKTENKNAVPLTASDDAKKQSKTTPAKKSAAKPKAAAKKQAD